MGFDYVGMVGRPCRWVWEFRGCVVGRDVEGFEGSEFLSKPV